MTMEIYIGKQEGSLKDYVTKFEETIKDDKDDSITILKSMKNSIIEEFHMYMELLTTNVYPLEKVESKLKYLTEQVRLIERMIKQCQ